MSARILEASTSIDSQLLVEAARSHVEDVVKPEVSAWEKRGEFPRAAVEQAAAANLCGLFVPVECGGAGKTPRDVMRVFEELGRGDAAYAFTLSMHNAVAASICRLGGNEVRERWVSALLAGQALGGFVVTELHGGSDPASNTTVAEPVKEGFRIRGRKAWVSLAGEADVFIVLAKLSTAPGYKDACLFAVDSASRGLRVIRLYDKMASSFLPIGDVEFDVEVPESCLLVPPGKGFQAALSAIDIARVDIAAVAVGLAAEARDVALHRAATRELYGEPLLSRQAIEFMLADIETDVIMGRLLYEYAAERLSQPDGNVAAAHAKRFCPEMALRAAIAGSEIWGGHGWTHDSPFPRFIALAKMLQVVDGTTEIQRVVIGRELTKRAQSEMRSGGRQAVK